MGKGRKKAVPWQRGLTTSVPEINQLGIYEDYVNMFTAWCMARFNWKLPDGCSQRFLEHTLFHHGNIVFYWDIRYEKYMIAACTLLGPPNVQGDIVAVRTINTPGYNGLELDCYLGYENRVAKEFECVLIYSNDIRIPEVRKVRRIAKILADLDTSITIASKALRNSRIAIIGQDQQLTYRNLFRKVDEGIPFLTASSTIDPNAITSLDVGGNPQGLKALREERNQYWNQAMVSLGINAANQDKKERLVEDEVSANDQHSMLARIAAINSRLTSVELINNAFPNSNVSVSWAVEKQTIESQKLLNESNGLSNDKSEE